MSALIDTNILFYAIDSSDNRKHEIAKEIAKRGFREETYISTQNLAEFYHQSKKKLTAAQLNEAKKIALAIIKSKSWIKISYDQSTLWNAMMKDDKKYDFWDLVIYFTAQENGVTEIITENTKDFEGLESIKITNPFR